MVHEHEEEEKAVHRALRDNNYYFLPIISKFYRNGKRMIHMTLNSRISNKLGLKKTNV